MNSICHRGKLSSLKVLWLDLNQLKYIPNEIGKLKKLQYLELSENMLETLPEEINGCVSLTDINLAQNAIEYLPSTIGQLANLSILKFDIRDTVWGMSSNKFSLNTNSSSISSLPISGGIDLILLLLKIKRRNLFNFPISGGIAPTLLNEHFNSFNNINSPRIIIVN